MNKGYREDLAYIHDVGFGQFAGHAAPVVIDWLQQAGFSSGTVVDLGCGSGTFARQLVNAGYKVHGVDISAAMVRIAKRQVPEASFVVDSLFQCAIPECVAVTAISECMNYAFDGHRGLPGMKSLFRRIRDALVPGGLFVFDLLQASSAKPSSRSSFFEGDDWAALVRVDEDPKRQRLTRAITSFRRVGKTFRRDREVHELRLFASDRTVAALRQTGFSVPKSSRYGGHALRPGHFVFRARKRSRR